MIKNFYHRTLLLVQFLCCIIISTSHSWANDDLFPKLPKGITLPRPIRPLPKIKRLGKPDELPIIKTIFEEDKDRKVKYTEDNILVDCIRYELVSDKKAYQTGEDAEIKIKVEFVDALPASWREEDCQKLALKLVFPKGFVQTGGTYYDFMELKFDEINRFYELIIKGQFYEPSDNACFLLLKGPLGSNWETIFVKKKELCLKVSGEILSKTLTRVTIGTDDKSNDVFKVTENIFQSAVAAACLQPPTITALSRCGSGTVTITATGCTNANPAFKWYDVTTGGVALFTGNPFTTPILSTNKTYYVECTSTTNACSPASPRRPVSVTINPNATATNPTTSSSTVCVGSNVTLTANTGTSLTYSWTGPNGFSSTSRTPVTAAPTSNGTYIVTVRNTSNCTSTASTIVYVKPLPASPILTGTPRCGTGTVNLSATGCSGTVNWYAALTGGTSLSTAANYTTPSISAKRNYFASCTFNGCTSSPRSSVEATVNPIPSAPTALNASRCGEGTVTLQANGCAGTVNWYSSNTSTASLASTASFTTPSLSTTTSYFANCTVNGCVSATRRTVTATITNPPSVVGTPTSSGVYCAGGTISITASGANTYSWTGPGGYTAAGATISRAATLAMGGIYTISGLATGNVCPGTTTVSITVNPIPTAATASSNSPVCIGNPLNLTASGGNVYTWAGPNSFTATTSSVTLTHATATMGGIYTITVKNTGCSASVTATTNVVINALPTPTITGITTICEGGTTSLTASGGSTYAWSGPNSFTATGASISLPNATLVAAGTYSVTATNAGLCTATATSNLTIIARPTALTLTGATTICSGSTTSLTATGCAGNIVWSNGETATSISVSPTTTTDYTATCTIGSCTSLNSSVATVTINDLPNAPTLAGATTICSGSTTSLTATSCAGSVVWSNGVTATSISVSPTTTTDYTATCTVGSCTSLNSSVATITVTPLPIAPTLTGTTTICSGSTTTLNGSCTTGTLTWYATPNGGNSIGVGNFTTPILNANTTYYAACETGGLTNCVSSRAQIDIITNPILTPTATTNNTTICDGQTATLTATGCGDFGYIWSNSLTSSSINVGSAGTYSVKCVIPGCETLSSNEINIGVIQQPNSPVINANGNSDYDPNTGVIIKRSKGYLYVTLQATGCSNGTLTWYKSGTVLGYGNNTYYYEDLNYAVITAICTENNCTSEPSNQIIIQGCSTLKPILTVSNANPATCEEITLTVTNIENIFTDGGGLITKYINNQYAGLVGFNNNNGIPGYGNYVATVKATESMSFDVYLAQSTPYCESQVSDKVSVNVSVPINKPTVINNIQSICSGESATFTASGCNGIYKWTNAYDGSVPAQYGATFNTPVYNVSGASAFGYNVACIVDNCESAVTVVSLTVYPKQTPTNIISNGSNLICNGNSITLSSTCPLGYDVVWNVVGATSSTSDYNSYPIIRIGYNTVTPTQTTTYFAYCISDGVASGTCISDASQPYTVTVNNNSPTTQTINANKTTLCSSDNDSVILTPSTCDGTVTWNWNNTGGSGTTTSIGSLTVTGLTQNTTYKSKCTNGCGTSANWSNEVTINVFTTPNAPTIIAVNDYGNYNTQTGIYTVPSPNGTTVNLQASGCSGVVNWSNGKTGSNISFDAYSNEIITANCTNINSCISQNSNSIILQRCTSAIPVLSVSNSTPNACDLITFTLSGCEATTNQILFVQIETNGYPIGYIASGNTYTIKATENLSYKASCYKNNPYCESAYSNIINITVNQGVNRPTVTNPFQSVCYGSTATFNATGCTGGTYKWYNEYNTYVGQGDSYTTGPLTYNVNSVTIARHFDYYVTCTVNGCEGLSSRADVYSYKVTPTPPTITPSPTANICNGQSIVLYASCPQYFRLEWSNSGVTTFNSYYATGTNLVSPTQTTSYFGYCVGKNSINDINGCYSVPSPLTFVHVANTPPTTQILTTNKTQLCTGSNDSVILTSSTCDGTVTWNWSNASGSGTTTSITNLTVTGLTQPTTYKSKCVNGCGESADWSNEITINVENSPVIASITANTPITVGATLNFSLNQSGGTTFNWTGPNNFASALQNPSITNIQKVSEGVYTATVTSLGGCTATATSTVTVLDNCECTVCNDITDANYSAYPTPLVTELAISNDKNYVEERIYLTEDASQFAQSISYFDGLGRPIEKVSRKTGADGKDVISFMDYDELGREKFKYLPYTDNHSLISALPSVLTHKTSLAAFYNAQAGKETDKDFAFAETVFENSPLNRVLQQGSTGTKWQPKTDPLATDNHAVKMVYTTNKKNGSTATIDDKLVNDIKLFSINTITNNITTQTVAIDTYEANQLYINITIDENGNRMAEIKTKEGQVVCKRVQNKANEFIETNYVYDDFGLLRFVFQPMATQYLTTTTPLTPLESTSAIKDLTFAYSYDERGRMTQKKVPSAAVVEMVYDNRDRLVLSQDAWGRANNRNRWIYTDYDELNRPLESGFLTNSNNRATLQSTFSQNNAPTGTKTYLTKNTYDAYTGTDEALFAASETYEQGKLSNVKGMVTKTETRIVSVDEINTLSANVITNVTFYDSKARAIKTVGTNHTGGTDISVTKLDFVGKAMKSKLISNYKKDATNTETRTIETKNSYDAGGRQQSLCQKIDTDNWERISKNSYFALGELKTKELGCDNSTGSPLALQNVDYTNNIRGWLMSINGVENTDLQTNKDLFGMRLTYDDTNTTNDNAEVSNTFFNGNIVKQEWNTLRSLSVAEVPSGKQTYDYKYDHLNRLMEANFTGSLATGLSVKMYDNTNPLRNYDLNGNIGYLKRSKAGAATSMDELIYSYTANQLNKVDDNGDANQLFKDKTNATDYLYDEAGNMKEDKNKDITLQYNYLNLPGTITRTNSTTNNGTIRHYYAGSSKVRMEIYESNGTTLKKAYDYVAGMVYITDASAPLGNQISLDFVGSPEGRVLLTRKVLNTPTDPTTGDKFRFEYSLKDHLGNLRVSCRCGEPKRDATGTMIPEGTAGAGIDALAVVQENHYDPWGLAFDASGEGQSSLTNKFDYNSKEKLSDLDLGWNDFGFRMYNSEIGRWNGIDPLTEISYTLTGYRYGFNNPISFTDFMGLWEQTSNGYSTSDAKDIERFFTFKALDKDKSIKNTLNFIHGERNGGGQLSDGSRVLTGINIYVKNTKFYSDEKTIDRTWHEVQGSFTPDALDPRTLNQNILGYTYPGPNNPKKYNGDDDYSYLPSNPIEYPGMIHDLAYDKKEARGATDLLTNEGVIEDDLRFVYMHYNLASYSNLDFKTRVHSVLLGEGLRVLSTPKMMWRDLKRGLKSLGKGASNIKN